MTERHAERVRVESNRETRGRWKGLRTGGKVMNPDQVLWMLAERRAALLCFAFLSLTKVRAWLPNVFTLSPRNAISAVQYFF